MKGKIAPSGVLFIERAGKFKKVGCPYGDGGNSCGDWCALFREPPDTDSGVVGLSLCGYDIIYFAEFTDERERDIVMNREANDDDSV